MHLPGKGFFSKSCARAESCLTPGACLPVPVGGPADVHHPNTPGFKQLYEQRYHHASSPGCPPEWWSRAGGRRPETDLQTPEAVPSLHEEPSPCHLQLSPGLAAWIQLRTEHAQLFVESSGSSYVDFPVGRPPLRLVFSGDEGSENLGLFLHLAHEGVAITYWPDLPHKIHRKQAAAFAGCPDVRDLLKRVSRVFRGTRGPWSSSRFGRARKESRARMISALDEFRDSNLLHTCLDGLARDQGTATADMTPARAVCLLKQHAGWLPKVCPKPSFLFSHCLPQQDACTGPARMSARRGGGSRGSITLQDSIEAWPKN